MHTLKLWLHNNLKGDPVIWAVVALLGAGSVLAVYSATETLAYKQISRDTEYYLLKHSGLMIFCFVAMFVAHKIPYNYYSKISRLLLVISVPLLLITFFYGDMKNTATRWLTIPIIQQSFQPSDLAKLALIANLASMLSKRQQYIQDFRESFVPILAWCGVICGLIALSNFSTGAMLFLTCLLLMFIGRVPTKFLAALVVVGMLSGTAALVLGQRSETVVSRFNSYFDPNQVPFQAEQSFIAIANGGMLGKGPGNSYQKDFLPHPYSDFIYAIIIEEYGMVGGTVMLVLYLVLLWRGIHIVTTSKDAFGGLLAAGLAFSLVIQALVNMAVAVGLIPITGQPLPLVSMGGTSLLFTGVSLGIILSVSRDDAQQKTNQNYLHARKAAL